MKLSMDHVIIAVPDLDAAIQTYRQQGFTVNYGGEHASGTTHNALVVFKDGTYLELMALTGHPVNPDNPSADYSYYVRDRLGVVGFAFRTDDLPQLVADIRQRGFKVNDIVSGSRLRGDGVRIEWQMAQLTEHESPFFLVDVTDRTLRVPTDTEWVTHENEAEGIKELAFQVDDPVQVVAFYEALLATESQQGAESNHFIIGGMTLSISPMVHEDKPQTQLVFDTEQEGNSVTRSALGVTLQFTV